MKPVKRSLRIWIAITSIFSFIGGWALFSHAGTPVSLFSGSAQDSSTTVTNLAPIPSLDSLVGKATTNGGVQSLQTQSNASVQSFTPRLRSRGS
jgi:hypothetical protein